MRTLGLILCFAIVAAVAKPQHGNDCKTVNMIKYKVESKTKCHKVPR